MPSVNRQWIYSKPITGYLSTDNFALRETPLPRVGQGQALVRNKLVSLDPANRVYFAMQTYRPQIHLGDVMAGFALGEVVESRDGRFRAGDIVHADLGWQDYAIINSYDRSEFVYKCSAGYPEDQLLGVLGITGLTAYFGLQEFGQLQPGETVVVGGATGACGVIVGQLAKMRGSRVIGFAGGPEKCRWLLDEMGFDGAVDYRDSNVARNLASLCPNGVDFFSDAIGGAVAQSTIPLMKRGARWYDYGNLSAYDKMVPGQTIPGDDELTPELKQRCKDYDLRPRYLLVFDYYSQRLRAEAELAGYLKDGRLKAPTTTLNGLEALPAALVNGTLGANRYGKLNVRIAD
jgi:NADPH-dependent curcumin reductase CurA